MPPLPHFAICRRRKDGLSLLLWSPLIESNLLAPRGISSTQLQNSMIFQELEVDILTGESTF